MLATERKGKSIAATDLELRQDIEFLTVGFRKVELSLTHPYVGDQQVVRDAANELIDDRPIVRTHAETRKVSAPDNPAIKQACKVSCFFAQRNLGPRQQLAIGRHPSGEFAVAGERRRRRTHGGKSAGLVNGTELLWIALDPTSQHSRIVVDIGIRTPRDARSFPHGIQENAESATLVASRIEIFVVLRGELIIREERDGVSGAIGLELNARGKSVDRHIGIIPELDGQNVTREIPWRWRDQCCGPQR